MSENQTNTVSRQEETINIKDLIFLYLSKWKWFVLSLAVCLGVAVLYLLKSPSVYTRSATLLIEDNDKGSSISTADLGFSDMGLFQSNTNVNNEIIAMSSPALMQNVVQRLNLDMNYARDGRFHDEVLYGTALPVNVKMGDLTENQAASMTLHICADESVELYDFELVSGGENLKYKERVKGHMREAVQTPIGSVTVTPTVFYVPGTDMEIFVSKSTLYGATTSYSSRLEVSLLQKEATVVSLSIKDVSVERANDVLNTLISAYNESWVEAKNQIAISTSAFIDDRLRVIEQELGTVEEDISSYKSENLIPDLQITSDLYIQQSSETEVKMLELSNRMYMAKYITDYLAKEDHAFELLPAGTGIESTGIESQISEYNNLVLQRNNLVASSSTSNPLVVDMDQNLTSMRSAIVTSLNNYTVMLQTQMNTLRQQESQATSRIAATPDQAKYLLSVERQQKVKESLYLFLLQKREENELSQAFTAYNTRLITPPTGSTNPTSPAKMQILLIAFVLGLAIPMGVFFIIISGNTKLRGKKDLDNMSVPYIGEIPMYDGKKRSIKRILPDIARRRGGKTEDVSIVVKEGNRDVVNEAFRVVRTNLEFMAGASLHHVYMTTSFNPGSGKTFITANMAMSLAIRGRKVLVIDGDLRRATASRLVQSPSTGLSDWLGERETDMEKILIRTDIHENLWIMPVGTIPPNPTELLQSGRLKQLIDTLKDRFDCIFIDCPPINIVADTQIISKVADRTVFIVRAGLLERSMLSELENDFRDGRYPAMCMVLNGTVSKGGRYGYRYGYQYGYNYGYSYYHQS